MRCDAHTLMSSLVSVGCLFSCCLLIWALCSTLMQFKRMRHETAADGRIIINNKKALFKMFTGDQSEAPPPSILSLTQVEVTYQSLSTGGVSGVYFRTFIFLVIKSRPKFKPQKYREQHQLWIKGQIRQVGHTSIASSGTCEEQNRKTKSN